MGKKPKATTKVTLQEPAINYWLNYCLLKCGFQMNSVENPETEWETTEQIQKPIGMAKKGIMKEDSGMKKYEICTHPTGTSLISV